MKQLIFKVILLIQISEVCLLKQVQALESVKEYHVSSFENPYFNTSRVQFGNDTTVYTQNDINKIADSLTQKVERENRIVDILEPNKAYTLPIGIVKDVGGLKYTIVLDELRFSSIELTAKAYMSLSFPGSSKKIGFVADDVKISVDGILS